MILILYYYLTSKANREKIEAEYNSETRISKKIHDELANDVFHVIAYAESQSLSAESTKENLLQKLDDIYGRVRGISRENNKIDTGTDFIKSLNNFFIKGLLFCIISFFI